MFNIASKYFSFLNNKPPASWVAHIIRDFLTSYSCSYYSSMVKSKPRENVRGSQPAFTCSKSTMETLEQCVKPVQS